MQETWSTTALGLIALGLIPVMVWGWGIPLKQAYQHADEIVVSRLLRVAISLVIGFLGVSLLAKSVEPVVSYDVNPNVKLSGGLQPVLVERRG